jgi:4-hydroxybenzoate polyprenyltransferase
MRPYAGRVTTAPAQPVALGKSLRLIAADIKLSHSVFAMPFAVLAAFMARAGTAWGGFAVKLLLIVACMVLARTWAMLVNRLADRDIDAANPRTRRRVFASGELGAFRGWSVAFACAVLFVLATALFWWLFQNPWPCWLSVPVLAWVALYSFTKRFTALCHIFLGTSLAVAPLAAAVAIRPEALATTPSIWWLAAFVVMWVAGFDVIYALQDEGFDRDKKLNSIPAALGSKAARTVSMLLHAGAALALIAAWTSHPELGRLFGVGVAIVLALLVSEHIIVARGARRGLAGLNMAFFTLNGVVSCVLGALGVIDLLV